MVQKHDPATVSARRPPRWGWGCWSQAGCSWALVLLQSCWAPSMPRPLPEVSVSCEHSEVSRVAGPGGCIQEPSAWAVATDEHAAGDGLHVSARQPTVEPTVPEHAAPHEVRAFPEEGGAGLCPRGGCVWMSSGWRAAGLLPAWEWARGRWSPLMVPSHPVSWQEAELTGGGFGKEAELTGGGFGQEAFSTKSKRAGALPPAPVICGETSGLGHLEDPAVAAVLASCRRVAGRSSGLGGFLGRPELALGRTALLQRGPCHLGLIVRLPVSELPPRSDPEAQGGHRLWGSQHQMGEGSCVHVGSYKRQLHRADSGQMLHFPALAVGL